MKTFDEITRKFYVETESDDSGSGLIPLGPPSDIHIHDEHDLWAPKTFKEKCLAIMSGEYTVEELDLIKTVKVEDVFVKKSRLNYINYAYTIYLTELSHTINPEENVQIFVGDQEANLYDSDASEQIYPDYQIMGQGESAYIYIDAGLTQPDPDPTEIRIVYSAFELNVNPKTPEELYLAIGAGMYNEFPLDLSSLNFDPAPKTIYEYYMRALYADEFIPTDPDDDDDGGTDLVDPVEHEGV